MSISLTPKFDDQAGQLREKVSDLSSAIYEKRSWKSCDEIVRHIYEGVATCTVYAIKGETDGETALYAGNGEAIHSQQLLIRARKVCRDEIAGPGSAMAYDAWTGLVDDYPTHNLNAHTNVGTDQEREREGLESVKRGLKLLDELLLDKIQAIPGWPPGTASDLLTLFKEIGGRLRMLTPYLQNPGISPAVKEATEADIDGLLGKGSLPERDSAYYVLILPPNPSEELRKALMPLMVFKWNFILDFGRQEGPDAVFPVWNQTVMERLNVLTENKTLSDSLVNWIFMRNEDGSGSKASARKLFDILSRHRLPNRNFLVFDLNGNKKQSFEALAGLWRLAVESDSQSLSQASLVFSVKESGGDSLESILTEEEYEVGGLRTISSASDEFLAALYAQDLFPISSAPLSDIIPERKRQQYLDGGLKFLDTDEGYRPKARWDNFYAGRQIMKCELEKQYDVFPRGDERDYHRFRKAIEEGLSSLARREFFIRHLPGAGGSTLVRRLAFDLEAASDNRLLTVWVSQWKPGRTPQQIKQLELHLSEHAPQIQRWLVISDDKELNTDEYGKLKSLMIRKNIPAVFLRLTHVTTLDNIRTNTNTLSLDSRLRSEREKDAFNDKFTKAFAEVLDNREAAEVVRNIFASSQGSRFPEMIWFPYGFTEKALEKEPVSLMPVDSYAKRWLDSLSFQRLKDTVGMIAFIYRFTNSKATDINTLRSLWNRSGHDFFPSSLSAADAEGVAHLLKRSPEEGRSIDDTSLYAPRYGAFASQILDAWRPAWRNQIVEISLEFIDLLPANGVELFNPVLSALLASQSWQSTDPDRTRATKSFHDKVSPLISAILSDDPNPDNVTRVFDRLILKYPDREFWKIQKARFLFEYADNLSKGPEDALFSEAGKIIENVFQANGVEDICYHVAGVFYKRLEKATYRAKASELSTREERECLAQELLEAGHLGIEKFREYNERVRGGSSYGYISGAELAVSMIEHTAWLRQIKGEAVLADGDIAILLGLKEDFLWPFEESEDLIDPYTRTRIVRLESALENLIGDRTKAVELLLSQFNDETADSKSRSLAGHQAVSMMLASRRKDNEHEPLKVRYRNLSDNEIKESETVLKILRDNNGDLKAAHKLFTLYRFTRRDAFEAGPTTDALRVWSLMAEAQRSSMDILKSAFFRYVCCAARLIDSTSLDSSLCSEYESWRRKSNAFGEAEEKNTGAPLLFLGRNGNGRWSSLMEPYEAFQRKDKRRVFLPDCRRFSAQLVEVDYPHQSCKVGNLEGVSFAYRHLTSNDIGTKELYNGVLGFRYSDPGLYDQQIRPIGAASKVQTVSEEFIKPVQDAMEQFAVSSVSDSSETGSSPVSSESAGQRAGGQRESKKAPVLGKPKGRRKASSGKFQFKSSKTRR